MAKSSGGSGRGGGGGSGGSSDDKDPITDKFPPLSSDRPATSQTQQKIGKDLIEIEATEEARQTIALVDGGPPYIQSITVYVNYTVNAGTSNPKNNRRIALTAKSMIDSYVKKAKEGTVLHNSPYTRDGKGADRISLYQRAGFSEPTKGNDMFAIVKSGKLVPITRAEIRKLKKLGHTD
jgi:hypothetical protein